MSENYYEIGMRVRKNRQLGTVVAAREFNGVLRGKSDVTDVFFNWDDGGGTKAGKPCRRLEHIEIISSPTHTTEFKVGDRVRSTPENCYYGSGQEGVITRIDASLVYAKMDENKYEHSYFHNGSQNSGRPAAIELVEEAPSGWGDDGPTENHQSFAGDSGWRA